MGIAAGVVAVALRAPPASRVMIGWDVGAAVYLVLTWRLFLTASCEEVRIRAANEDETPLGLLFIVIGLIIASLVAIVVAMVSSKASSALEQAVVAALAATTLVLSWVMLQTIFALHYAHRHFADTDGDGKINGGFLFAGEPAGSYLDFVYLSFCIGATFQVSDTSVETARLRNLITAHGAIAYFYNTTILALGINILASLVGH